MSNPPRSACAACGQVYVGWLTLDTKCERCGEEVVEYEVGGLDNIEQKAAEAILELCQRQSAWT